jgi:SSS family solute:Na+ symporter
MSSASSDAIAGVSILLRDVYMLIAGSTPKKNKIVLLSRWGLIGITAMALIFTLYSEDIINYIKNMISIVMSGMFVCVIMGKYWARATWQGGLATLIGGAACSITIMNVDDWMNFWGNPIIPAVICASVGGIIVSLLTPRNKISDDDALAILASERETMEMQSGKSEKS